MSKSFVREHKGHKIRASVSEIQEGQFHAFVSIEHDDGQVIIPAGFLSLPLAATIDQALEEGWRCAQEQIDSRLNSN
jgi:hypothetical protein